MRPRRSTARRSPNAFTMSPSSTPLTCTEVISSLARTPVAPAELASSESLSSSHSGVSSSTTLGPTARPNAASASANAAERAASSSTRASVGLTSASAADSERDVRQRSETSRAISRPSPEAITKIASAAMPSTAITKRRGRREGRAAPGSAIRGG